MSDFTPRRKEITRSAQLEDGTTQEVHEVYEEVVPMRVASRITRRMKLIPIEEKTESFAEDGAVETSVKTLPESRLDISGGISNVDDLMAMIQSMNTKKPCCKGNKSFVAMANKKYGEAPVVVSGSGSMLTTIAWIVAAIICAVLVYALLMGF